MAEFRFDNSISKISHSTDSVDVEFLSGSSESYDLLIGADGLHSVTRQLAFEESEVNKNYLGRFSSAYKLDNVLEMTDKFENHMEQNRYMCVYTTGKGDLACVFIWKDENQAAPDMGHRADYLRKAFSGCPDTVETVLEQCPDNGFYMDALIQIDMPSWSKGRVVLVGDAAHSLTLLSGQGASTAFWGASSLCKALLEYEPEQAFRMYEHEIRPVVNKVQPAVRSAAKWYIPGNRQTYLIRDALMSYLPNAFFQSYFKRKYNQA